jgi:hypothetical protein
MPLMWLKCLILILKMAWAKLISFLNRLISKISQNKPVKPVKFFSSFPNATAIQRADHPENAPGLGEERIFQWPHFRCLSRVKELNNLILIEMLDSLQESWTTVG